MACGMVSCLSGARLPPRARRCGWGVARMPPHTNKGRRLLPQGIAPPAHGQALATQTPVAMCPASDGLRRRVRVAGHGARGDAAWDHRPGGTARGVGPRPLTRLLPPFVAWRVGGRMGTMFETIAEQIATAAEKLTHLRRFL